MPPMYINVLMVAAILCFIAIIALLVPMIFDYWRRWRQSLQMWSPHTNGKSSESAATTRQIEHLTNTADDHEDALGWSAEEDSSNSMDGKGTSGVAPAATLGEGKTILIADDDPVVVLALSRRLQQQGYTVLRSPDAVHALMGAIKTRPDLIILDINMPSGNGLAVCEMMASDPKYANIPVIIHSVVADEATQERCRGLHAYHVEKSPQSWAKIKLLVSSLLQTGDPVESRSSADTPVAENSVAKIPNPKPPRMMADSSLPSAPTVDTKKHVQASMAAPQAVIDDATSPTCGHQRVLCIESPKGRLEFLDHQLSGLGIEVTRTSDLEEGFWTCFTEKPHVVVIHAKSTDTKLLALLNRLATHPVTRKLSVLWVNEDNTVVEGLQSLTPNLKILKHPMDWEDMLGELEKLLPMFGRQWDDPLTRIPSPAPKTSVPDHPTTTPESRHMVAAVEPKTLTVLCIDDDPVVARSIAIRLQPYGIKVREADDGTQGYLMATAEQPDLIVLDLKMPHGEGNFVIGKLKDNPRTKNIPVIILTVETSASARRQMLSLGADAFLTKPMQWPELFAEMGRCVQLPKQLLADYHLPEQLTIQQL